MKSVDEFLDEITRKSLKNSLEKFLDKYLVELLEEYSRLRLTQFQGECLSARITP